MHTPTDDIFLVLVLHLVRFVKGVRILKSIAKAKQKNVREWNEIGLCAQKVSVVTSQVCMR